MYFLNVQPVLLVYNWYTMGPLDKLLMVFTCIPAWNCFSSLPLVLRAEVQPLRSRWRLKFNINTGRAILETRHDGGSRAGALNCGSTARSAAICSAVRRANLKAGAKDGVGQ